MSLPSLEYLLTCSINSLQEWELAALNRSQQSLKTARLEMEEAVAQREAAGIARWLIEHRPSLLEEARRTIEAENGQPVLAFPEAQHQLPSSSYLKQPAEDTHTSDTAFSLSMRRYSYR